MTNSRIQQIEQMLTEDPHDPFLHYARCLEYSRISPLAGQPYWDKILSEFPDYVPVYYQAGSCYSDLGLKDRAIEIWRKGAVVAEKQQDRHALTELKSRIQNALIEEEDES